MYLFTTFFSVVYLFLLERKFHKLAYLLVILPVALFFYQVPAFQFDVGTDYMSYVDMYKYGYNIEYYYSKKEYVFYVILKIVTTLGMGEQSIFLLVSIVYTFFWVFFIFLLKKENYKVWILVFLYFTVTGIYQNQLNGLRQYMAISVMPCLFILLYNRKYWISAVLVIFASLCHASFIIVYPFLAFLFIKPTPVRVVTIFFLTGVVYALILPKLLPLLVELLFGSYLGYFESKLSASANLFSLITKLYYAPLILLSMHCYYQDVNKGLYNKNHDMLMSFFMIAAATYWLFVVNLYFGFFGRVAQYFMIFYIFPMYYLIDRYIERKKVYSAVIIFAYILIPYILKVTVLATSEYDYQSILSGF